MKHYLLFTIWLLLSIYASAQTAPVANSDVAITNEDTPVTFNVTTNDIDINVSTVDFDPSTAGIQNTFTVSGEGTYLFNILGDVTFTPVANYNGIATPVNYTVNDLPGTTLITSTISITVTSVNDVPSFIKGSDQTVCENNGVQTVSNWATALSAGPPDESSQILSFTATNDNNALFSVQPIIDATGKLTYTPASNQSGSATITVHINDNGGVYNDGVDKSADQTFVITINPLPTTFNVTGGGSYCSGGSGVAIGLSGSQTDVTYQLYSVSTPVGSPVAGTGSVLSFGNQTTAGTNYNVIATNTTTTCIQNMSGSATVTINPLPTTFTVTGGGFYCSGGSGVAIGLSGSETSVSYQLYSASTPVGSLVAGTGSALSFGNQTTAGTNYTVIATNTTTTCIQNMSGSATVTINPLPTIYSVTGGGSYCSGGSGVTIGLSGSETSVSYQLYSASTPVGSLVAGTGSALSFGNQTTAGANYTVIATNTTTTCIQNMSGSVTITINPLPTIYTVTGGGFYCSGGSGVAIGLSGSETSVSYQLYSASTPVGSLVAGTGSALSFGNQTTAGTNYTVIATNTTTTCIQNMSGSATVTINPLPTIYSVTGGGSYCSGGSGVTIGLSGSETSVSYQLYSASTPVGSLVAGTGSALSFGNQTTAGANYTVIATNTTTTCTQNMSGSAIVTINALPTTFTVTGGGSYCSGGSGVAIGLSGSETSVSYQLYSASSPVGSPVAGTGSVLSFGNQTTAGTNYTVIATNTTTTCTQNMSGSAIVTINALPTTFTVTGGGSYCSGGSGVAIGLSGSQSGVTYQLYSASTPVGSPVSGTGSALSFGNQTTAGTNYTVIATNTTTTCIQNMSGSATVTINPLPTIYSVTGGGSYCSGGSGVTIGLSGSETSVSYQLYSASSPVGSPVSGTGSVLSFGNQTTAGTNYTVIATNTTTTCTQNMSGSAIVTINALPTTFTVNGGGSYCSGGSGVAIGLSGSQSGVTYQLYSASTPVGSPVAGTGSVLSFGNQTTAGTNYTVIATNTTTTCTQNMNGSVTVTINPLPTTFTVTGGGSYCSGGSGVAIGLSGSQTGVSYQLYSASTPVGLPVSGTGSALSFGNQTTAGANYNVIATNATTTCTQNMSGSATVTINTLPINPTVSTSTPSNVCPLKTVDLTSLLTSTTPSGGGILFKTTNNPLGLSITDPTKAGAGTYFIFYQNSSGCYSPSTAVTVAVNNCPPIANSAMNATIPSTAGATAIYALTATDDDGTIAGYTVLTLPLHGILYVGGVVMTAGQVLTPIQVASLTYDPNGSFIGNDTFTFTAKDNNTAVSNIGIFTIPVGNNPPVANNATNATIPSTAGVTATTALTATDSDGSIASYTVLTLPSHGTLSIGGTAITAGQILTLIQATTLAYDPNGVFTGNDTFTFTATDNSGATDPSPATITIPVGNNPPVANSATNVTILSTAGTTALSALSGTDSDGTIAGYTILTLPSHGTLYVGGVMATTVQALTLFQATTLTYDPNGTFTGNDSFTFTTTDNNGGVSSPATITIPIANNPPVANSGTNATIPSTAGATAISALTATDSDGTISGYTVLTLPLHGILYVNGILMSAGQVLTPIQVASLTYDPNGSFIGNDSFTFTAKDNNNAVSNIGIFTIPVGNNPPVANNATNAIIPSTAGATVISALTATDSDGSIASYTVLTLPSHGTLSVGGTAITAGQILTLIQATALTYDPNGTFTGNDTFTFTATDNSGATDPSPATITIPVGNNLPVANNATNVTIPSTAGATALSALSGTDSDGTIAGYTILTLPSHGTLYVGGVMATTVQVLTLFQATTLTYDPNGSFTGNDSFTFTATDNNGGVSSPATITIPIGNNPPVANSATNTTIPSTAGATAISVLTATDSDGTISGYTVLTLPLHGILYVNGIVMTAGQILTAVQVASLTYDPNGSFIGNDSFTFTAKDNNNAVSNIGIFTIPVGNNPPVANNATNATIASTVDATAISALTAADSDGTIASYTVLTLPSHGTLSVGGTAITAGQILTLAQASALTYDPDGSFIGNDSFTFLATDNNNSVSNTATISIPVGNNPPVANSATNPTIPSTAGATTLAALTATDTDGSIVSYTILTLPSHGILSLAGIAITMGQVLTPIQASVITYLPNGTHTGNDSFIFTATDNSGTIDTTPATITIPVGNTPPVANPDVVTTNEDTSVSFNITTNDTDTDGTIDVSTVDLNPLSAGRQTTFTVSEQGSYVVDNLGVVTFTPFANYNGTAIPVNYTVNDNLGAISNISTISVTVTPINDPPVATPDTKTTAENNAVTLNVTTNDTDIDGTVDVATVDLNPSITGRQTTFTVSGQGTYTVNNLGVVTFTPVANYNGNATPIGYTVNDNNGAVSNTSTITITVTALNAAPVPVDDNATTTQNVNVKISVLDNDSFGINGSSTGTISATNGSHGTVLVDNGGTPDNPTDDKIIYAPNSGYIGSDTFTYTICNSKGSCSTANVTVTIHPLSGIFIINMSSTKPVMNRDGVTFSWAYIITLNNKQSQLVDSIRIVDDLNKAFEVSPKPTFTVTKVSVSGNTLNVNNAYNGVTDINLLSGRSYLNANTKDSIIIEVNVNPAGYAGQLLNKAYLDGLTAVGKIKDAPSDDVNLPGAFDETITTLKGVDLIIPEGFTPNIDGYNDNFVIVHSDLVKLKLSIFNRWGSQVYSSTDYKNNWDGKGSGGNDLPTGTYFLEIFVIEVSTGNIIESEIRSITLIR